MEPRPPKKTYTQNEMFPVGSGETSAPAKKAYTAEDLFGKKKEKPLTESDKEMLAAGLPPVDEATANPALARVKARFGESFSDTPFTSEAGDFWLTTKMGYNDSEEGKRQVIKNKYPDGDYRIYDMGEDGLVEIATKDGKTWHQVGALEQGVSSVVNLENIVSSVTGAGAGANLTYKVVKPALGAAFGRAADQFLKGTYDEGAKDPYSEALNSFVTTALIGGVAEGLVSPLIKRTGITSQSIGAEEALDAQANFLDKDGNPLLEPITRGQATSSFSIQSNYKQYQSLFEKARENALKRFQSLDKGLYNWVDQHGLKSFDKPELEALALKAAFDIDSSLSKLASGRSPLAAIGPDLKNALDLYNETARISGNEAYEKSFDSAVANLIELDFKPVKDTLKEIERGIPVQKDVPADVGISDAIGAVGGGKDETIKYLGPNAKLQRMVNKAKQVADVLSVHIKDGNYYSSLEQMNAVRREFSEFAWENAGTNQGRLATQVLDSIDKSIANPVSGYSPEYAAAFKKAQEQYGAWKAIKEIKAISKLQDADVSTYQNYVVNMVKPGNGPLLEMMDTMFKGTPGAMKSVRNAYVDFLADSPHTIEKTLDNLQKKDPRLLQTLFPEKGDLEIVRKFGKDKTRLDKSWFVKQTELEMLTEGQRALDMLSGNPDTRAQKVKEYLDYGGPNAREAVMTALLHDLQESSKTLKSDLLGTPVIDADVFISRIKENEDLIKQVFTEDEFKRLTHLENYALKIKDTAVGLPALKGSGNADTGTSLMIAQVGAEVGKAVSKLESQGPVAVAKKFFAMYLSPWYMAKILGVNDPVKKQAGSTAARISEDSLQSMINFSRVAGNAFIQAQSRHPEPSAFDENVYTP